MLYVVMIIGIFAIVAFGSVSGLGQGSIIIIGIVFTIVCAIILGSNRTKKLKALQEKTKDMIQFNEKTGVVNLKQRDISFAKRFTYERYESTRYGYTPEKYILTSATVGGVTTGGIDKVGGYGTETQKTDKYNLVYEYVDPEDNVLKKAYVDRIVPSKSLLEQARNSKIKDYLYSQGIRVVEPLVSSEKEIRTYLELHKINGGGYMTHIANLEEEDKIRTLPDLQKCTAIISWISGND